MLAESSSNFGQQTVELLLNDRMDSVARSVLKGLTVETCETREFERTCALVNNFSPTAEFILVAVAATISILLRVAGCLVVYSTSRLRFRWP